MAECKINPALKQIEISNKNQFTLLSFNILRKDFVYRHDEKIRYKYCDIKYKKWEYRHPKLLDIISNFNADIVCLQECAPYSFKTDFVDILNKKYNFNYNHIIDGSNCNKDEKRIIVKPATLWNMDKFKMIFYEFRSRPSLLLLKMLSNDSYLFIINVHLIGYPEQWIQRFNQIKSIMKRIILRCNTYKIGLHKAKIIICGDFNSPKTEVIDKLLLDGIIKKDYKSDQYPNTLIPEKGLMKKDYKHLFCFKEAYDIINDRQPTFGANGNIECYDFIYYTHKMMKCLGITKVIPSFLEDKNHKINNLQLPTKDWVSDHLPIYALMEMTDQHIKKEDNEGNKASSDEWYFHEMHSF